ncbi:MAG: ChaN family lipoprotein [Almyronema sp.]
MNLARLLAVCSSTLLWTVPWACGVAAPEAAQPVVRNQGYAEADVILQTLQQADVIYLGETHSQLADHQAQLEIIQALHQANPQLAIALEMFQRPFQPVIDRYLAGEISEAELVQLSEYEQRWGFPWEYYAPILRYAKANGLPVLALNTPAETTRKVARQGLASLATEDFRYIPPVADIDLDSPDYRLLVQDAFSLHSQHGGLDFENFFAAQVLWDETMAATLAEFLSQNPDYQVVTLAGQGHVVYDYGIPSRVARRLGAELIQQTVLLNPSAAMQAEGAAIADFFWFSSN